MLSLSEGREENATAGHRSPRRSLASLFASLQALISMRLVSLILRPTSLKVREEQEIYVADVTPLNKMLLRPALLGFVGSLAILAGASQQNSPFTLKLPGAWWFGIPASHPAPQIGGPGQWLFLGVFGVYGGMLLMLRAWYDVIRLSSRVKGIPVRRLVPVFIAWTLPLLIVAPLFSNDAYSYAAQGELMSHHINPYLYGPGLLSTGTTFDALTARIWQNVTSPYGPVFLVADGWIVEAMRHNVLATVEALRVLALAGVVMFAAAVPSIARSFGRDQATAFSLAVLNPLILLNLVAGEHNDALMLGFLLSGYALFKRGRPVLGIFLCGIAAAIKIPGFIGVIYIGWEWLGPGKSVRERVRPMIGAFAIAGVAMAACVTARRSRVALGSRTLEPRQRAELARSGHRSRAPRRPGRESRRTRQPRPSAAHDRPGIGARARRGDRPGTAASFGADRVAQCDRMDADRRRDARPGAPAVVSGLGHRLPRPDRARPSPKAGLWCLGCQLLPRSARRMGARTRARELQSGLSRPLLGAAGRHRTGRSRAERPSPDL